jgi:hypothetical protein
MSPSDERRTTRLADSPSDVSHPDRGSPTGRGTPPSRKPPPKPAGPGRSRSLPRSLVAALAASVVVLVLAVSFNVATGALDRLNPFRDGLVQEQTIDRSGPAVLKAISDLGEFHAASGYYELVVDVERDVKPVPSFLAGERVLFVAAGTVDVAVNLRGLGPDAISVNESRTSATITLPRPRLTQPRVDMGRSYIYSHQRGLVNRVGDAVGGNPSDERELYTLAEKRLAEAAGKTGELMTRGETNTRTTLQGLLKSLGFTDVTVTFAG